jgi:deoxyribodipyrimidine photolyase-related protein
MTVSKPLRDLILVLGDQLDIHANVLSRFDPTRDRVWMGEVHEEATHVWCHKTRLMLFFSTMRHFSIPANGDGYDQEGKLHQQGQTLY